MAWCPHCDFFYDEDNESQPCCGLCGHPISCGCGGHDDVPPSHSPYFFDADLSDARGFDPDDDLPF